MRTRDVATVAFRLLALWTVVSALTSLVDLLANWKTVAAQVMGTFSDVSNPPTRGELLWMSTSALVGRGVLGLLLWWLSPTLARLTSPREDPLALDSRQDLHAAAAFLVGVWLIASSAPGLAFAALVATRPGVPAYPETQPQVPLLLAQLVLGLALLRARWLIGWAVGRPVAVTGRRLGGAVEQADAADERRDL